MKIYRCLILLIALMTVILPSAAQDEALPVAHRVDLSRVGHVYQGWNNCGPATLTMGLSYYGYPSGTREAQFPAASYLKPNTEDQNVSPWQMVDYVNNQIGADYNLKAIYRVGGSFDLLKRLLVNDFPVIIEEGFEPVDHGTGADLGWMGHYVLVVGYDDSVGVFTTYDSYDGPGLNRPYDEVLRLWQHFNNVFIIAYPPEREADLQAVLGELWDEKAALEKAKADAQARAAANINDHWAWFNLGEAMSALGEYDTATIAYRQAFDSRQMPFRTLWYMHGAFEAFYHTGQFNKVNELAATIQGNDIYIEEANYYRALVMAAQGRKEDAIYRFNLVLAFNPNFYPAAEAIAALEAGTFVGPAQTD